jgi:hypothetical protein
MKKLLFLLHLIPHSLHDYIHYPYNTHTHNNFCGRGRSNSSCCWKAYNTHECIYKHYLDELSILWAHFRNVIHEGWKRKFCISGEMNKNKAWRRKKTFQCGNKNFILFDFISLLLLPLIIHMTRESCCCKSAFIRNNSE